MPRHKGLNLQRFLFAVPPEHLRRYFERLGEGARPGPWATQSGGV